jgi:hypothetical protein
MANNKEVKKVLPQRESVHVVFFSCQNCGEETDYIQFCPDCGKAMRVIDVVEKFGDDAQEFIKKIEDRQAENATNRETNFTDIVDDNTEPNIIVLSDNDSQENFDDGAIEDVASLDEIFPDDGDSDIKISGGISEDLSDLDDIVAELDKEDDDFSLDDLGEEGLPEL